MLDFLNFAERLSKRIGVWRLILSLFIYSLLNVLRAVPWASELWHWTPLAVTTGCGILLVVQLGYRWLWRPLGDYWVEWRYRAGVISDLKRLTRPEKMILVDCSVRGSKAAVLNPQNPVVNGLAQAGIVVRAGRIGHLDGMPFNVSDFVWEYTQTHPEVISVPEHIMLAHGYQFDNQRGCWISPIEVNLEGRARRYRGRRVVGV